ncbi:MAG: hypothetical protein IJ512_09365 [Ruminococcus sp.]|nr:hypothetical protein [Ruminococcus sp.]
MKSYEEVVQNVFQRGDEYLRKKEKRAAAIEKGVSIMSVFSMITLFGLGLLSSNMQNPVTPENANEIVMIETASVTEALSSGILSRTAETTSAGTQTAAERTTTAETTVTAVTSSPAASIATTAVTTEPAATTAAPIVTTEERDTVTQTTMSSARNTDTTVSSAVTATVQTVTTTLPATTDSDASRIQVVSITDDCIISEIAHGTTFQYITYYRGFVESCPLYLGGTELTSFHVVTAETYADLQEFDLPTGAEIVDLNALAGSMPTWGWMEQKFCLDEVTDPYIIVGGADGGELYRMENVKSVYQLELYRCTEAQTVEWSDENYVVVISSEDISLEGSGALTVTNEEILLQDIQKVSDLPNGQKVYHVFFQTDSAADYSEESMIQHFDLCRTFMEYDFIDASYPSYCYPETIPGSTYALQPVANPYADAASTSGTFNEIFSWNFSGDTLTFAADTSSVYGDVILTTGTEDHLTETRPWSQYLPYAKRLVFGEGIISLGADIEYDLMQTNLVSDSNALSHASSCTASIYCYPDMGAEKVEMMRSYGATVIVLGEENAEFAGDANLDCVVDINDASAVLQYYAHIAAGLDASFVDDADLNAFACYLADVDAVSAYSVKARAGQIDISDATAILGIYANAAAGITE